MQPETDRLTQARLCVDKCLDTAARTYCRRVAKKNRPDIGRACIL
jgi:hypothetical protein